MPIPMPTVVAKGSTALSLDKRYSTPHGRWASLKALRASGPNSKHKTGMDVGQAVKSLSSQEAQHLRQDWFTAGKDHWMMLKPFAKKTPWHPYYVYISFKPKQPDLNHGERVLVAGLIQALECSLGLAGPDDEPQLRRDKKGVPIVVKELEQVDVCALPRNLPVAVYWVCGKLDGFEVQVSWNEREVTCLILTPQVAEAADVFQKTYTPAQFKTVKTSATEGMLVTTTKKGSRAKKIETIVLARQEGGVTPHPLPSRFTLPRGLINAPAIVGGPQ